MRLDALELVRTAGGWSVRDTGTDGGVFVDGCRVVQLPLHPGRPITLRLGAADGAELTLEVLGDVVDEPRRRPRGSPASPGAAYSGSGAGQATTSFSTTRWSRQPASLELASPPILRDLGSYDGTFVNGERITAIPLRPGDQITIVGRGLTWDGLDFTGQARVAGRCSAWRPGARTTSHPRAGSMRATASSSVARSVLTCWTRTASS